MNRIHAVAVAAASFLCLSGPAQASPWHHHHDEDHGKLAVHINFLNAAGFTETDEDGIRYFVGGKEIGQEDKVYPDKYWGIFPLYFFENLIGVKVGITNHGKHAVKLEVFTESHVLEEDGTNAADLGPSESHFITVKAGHTVTVDASFIGHYSPDVTSGLDRFSVTVYRVSDGKTLAVKEGIFCPPELEEWVDFLP